MSRLTTADCDWRLTTADRIAHAAPPPSQIGGLDRIGQALALIASPRRASCTRSTTTCSVGRSAERRRARHRRTSPRAPSIEQPAEALACAGSRSSSAIAAPALAGRCALDAAHRSAAPSSVRRRSSRPARPPRRWFPSRSRDASTIGKSKPISSRVPAGSSAELRGDDLRRFAHDFLAAAAAERAADAREQQPHVVVDFGRRADGRARIADAVLLADGDRRRDAVDAIDVRLLHPLEKLPGVGGQRLDVAALSFGVDRVEGERRLARSADAGDDDQLAGGQRDVDVLEVVRARAANDEIGGFNSPGCGRIGHARCTTLCCEFSDGLNHLS